MKCQWLSSISSFFVLSIRVKNEPKIIQQITLKLSALTKVVMQNVKCSPQNKFFLRALPMYKEVLDDFSY